MTCGPRNLEWPRRLRAGVAAVALLALPATWAQPVVLHLKNGDRLTGTITSENGERVLLTTPWAKDLTVPVGEIVKREAVNLAAPPAPAAGANPASATSAVAGAVAPGGEVQPTPPRRWGLDAQIGVDLGFSGTSRQLYSGRLKATYAHRRLRNIFDYLFAYGQTDGTLSANRMDGALKTDVDVGRRVYLYNLAGAGYDEIRRIDFRYEVGPGVGYHLIVRPAFVLNTEFGMNYQAQYLADNRLTELFYYRLAEDSTWRITPRITFDQKFEFFPQVEDLGEYRFRFEANLRYWLLNNLSLNLTVLDQYDTALARTSTRNDLQVRSTIGVKY
jgi:hypothetical protein